MVHFEWNMEKAAATLAERKVSFGDAARAWNGSGSIEDRIGMAKSASSQSAKRRKAESSSSSGPVAGTASASSRSGGPIRPSAGRTVRKSLGDLEGQTDWAAFDALTDAEIEAGIIDDPDAAPILDEAWFRDAELVLPATKVATSIRVDGDVMEWFRAQGRGWQTRMNAVLRAYAKAHDGVK